MLIINTILESISSRRDKSFKLIFGTNELTPDQVKEVSAALQKFIYLALKVDDFKTEEKEILDDLESGYEDTNKSQSQRIRAVLFILWKQSTKGFEDFELYYKHMTEMYISHLKSKIEP